MGITEQHTCERIYRLVSIEFIKLGGGRPGDENIG